MRNILIFDLVDFLLDICCLQICLTDTCYLIWFWTFTTTSAKINHCYLLCKGKEIDNEVDLCTKNNKGCDEMKMILLVINHELCRLSSQQLLIMTDIMLYVILMQKKGACSLDSLVNGGVRDFGSRGK